MFYYEIYGLKVASDFELAAARSIPAFPEEERQVLIHSGSIDEDLLPNPDRKIHPEEKLITGYDGKRCWVRSLGNGCFVLRDGQEVLYRLEDTYSPLLVCEIFLCLCLGLIMIQRDGLMLHGSAVRWGNDGALIISGKSGSGKSTLTAALLQAGGVFMADDAVALQVDEGLVYAYPSYPQQKLTAAMATAHGLNLDQLIALPDEDEGEKYALRLDEGSFCAERQPVRAMIVLCVEDVEQGSIKKITGNAKLQYFTDNLYKVLTYQRMGFGKKKFMESVYIADRIEIYELVRPLKGISVEEEAALVYNALAPA